MKRNVKMQVSRPGSDRISRCIYSRGPVCAVNCKFIEHPWFNAEIAEWMTLRSNRRRTQNFSCDAPGIHAPQHSASIASAYQGVIDHAQPAIVTPKGLKNLGKTCHVNSVVTALSACAPFRTAVRVLAPRDREVSGLKQALLESAGRERCLWNQILSVHSRTTAVAVCPPPQREIPSAIMVALASRGYKPRYEQDAHESFVHIMDILEEQPELVHRGKVTADVASTATVPPSDASTNSLRRVLETLLTSKSRCIKCRTCSSSRVQSFGHLEVYPNGPTRLDLLIISSLVVPQSVDKKCRICQFDTSHFQTWNIERFAPLLTVHINRAILWSTRARFHQVLVPEVLYLPQKWTFGLAIHAQYRLASVIHFQGQSGSSGHFTVAVPASARGLATVDEEKWCLVSDDMVMKCTREIAFNPMTAYMAFYILESFALRPCI